MEKEEETREILLPNWQGSGSHGITIDQTDDGVFVKRVQQNSPAAKMGVVKEGGTLAEVVVGKAFWGEKMGSLCLFLLSWQCLDLLPSSSWAITLTLKRHCSPSCLQWGWGSLLPTPPF